MALVNLIHAVAHKRNLRGLGSVKEVVGPQVLIAVGIAGANARDFDGQLND
ncbi:hypothetical protein ABIB27_001614 [Arthrobacter sp. UYEF21]